MCFNVIDLFSLSVFSRLDSLLILGEQLPPRLDMDEKGQWEEARAFPPNGQQLPSLFKSDDILAG